MAMASSSSLMASQTLILRNPRFLSPPTTTLPPSLFLSNPRKTLLLSIPKPPKSRVFASSTPNSPNPIHTPIQSPVPLPHSTRAVETIVAITITVSKLLAHKLSNFIDKLKSICSSPSPDEVLAINHVQDTVMCTVGPLFFASINSRMNTPLTVVAAGMHKWLKIYSGVLMIRVLLSWFPNIPWDRQPLSAMRDLCDPYLSLFRSVIPPLFNALDVSPIFAFLVLGSLARLCRVS